IPRECPSCQEYNTMSPYGVGIERILEGIQELIPKARSVVLSSNISRLTNAQDEKLSHYPKDMSLSLKLTHTIANTNSVST
ncbi:hypothetical protein, partial [Anaplasma phagocytophilum]|uniref:hypothetical protein n=1 Tax=Anaplasma phagocytophilum TaxID=948 RepID=UPI00201AB706